MRVLMLMFVLALPILLFSCHAEENGCTIKNIEKVTYNVEDWVGYTRGEFNFLASVNEGTYAPKRYFAPLGGITIVYDVPPGGKAWIVLGESGTRVVSESRNTCKIETRKSIELHVRSQDDIQYIAKKD